MGPIGVFDSGYGGLSILQSVVKEMPAYNYLYLGDNARNPYGNRSFETVYQYTLEAVRWLFKQDCSLVLLACNTASAKALRTIQQNDLPKIDPDRRVLGVIRPSAEAVDSLTKTRHIGVLGTVGTVKSQSYPLEISKLYPDIVVQQEACPLWVPLIENGEAESLGADYFVEKYINELLNFDPLIDCVILACTHYPLMMNKIKKYLPAHIQVVAQGDIVASSLQNYLQRHSEMELRCEKGGERTFYTTDTTDVFNSNASLFFGGHVDAIHAIL